MFAKEAPLTVAEQTGLLVAGAVLLLLLFFLFALASDWGSAHGSDTKSCCFSKHKNAASGTAAAAAAVAKAKADPTAPAPRETLPAVLEWKNLKYAVALSQNGGGVLGFFGRGRRRKKPQLSVLSRVSGFAGPREALLMPTSSGTGAGVGNGSTRSASISALPRGGSGALLLGPQPQRTKLETSSPKSSTLPSPGTTRGKDSTTDQFSAAATATVVEAEAEATATPSTMTGILGPSGAGKSSLLDVLAGRKRSGQGCAVGQISLVVDGDKIVDGSKGYSKVRQVAGYVPQEDVLPGTLSCYEHLMFHGRLRMPRKATHADRRERALLVLEELGLSRVADARIGDAQKRGLSGGEKRRLSIAAELMARPPLLFLDEPTTGLGEIERRALHLKTSASHHYIRDNHQAISLCSDQHLIFSVNPPPLPPPCPLTHIQMRPLLCEL